MKTFIIIGALSIMLLALPAVASAKAYNYKRTISTESYGTITVIWSVAVGGPLKIKSYRCTSASTNGSGKSKAYRVKDSCRIVKDAQGTQGVQQITTYRVPGHGMFVAATQGQPTRDGRLLHIVG